MVDVFQSGKANQMGKYVYQFIILNYFYGYLSDNNIKFLSFLLSKSTFLHLYIER
jgi:hypothetical protein